MQDLTESLGTSQAASGAPSFLQDAVLIQASQSWLCLLRAGGYRRVTDQGHTSPKCSLAINTDGASIIKKGNNLIWGA